MCVIIDANQASNFFQSPSKPDFEPIWEWITNKDGRMIIGGKLTVELTKVCSAIRFLTVLLAAGRAIRIDDKSIRLEEDILKSLGICTSNDIHIIALARASGARVLCTNDTNLENDFKNSKLISKPRGKIYKNKSHQKLLKHNGNCNI